MVLPLLLALAPSVIGGAISAFGAASQASAQQRAQAQYLEEYAEYRRNVESTPQITRHETTRNVDFFGMVRAAEAAGFNPLSVLQAGGIAAYTQENTVITAPQLWVPPAPREGYSPGGAAASAFGQSVSNIDLSAAYSNYMQGQLAGAQIGLTHAQTRSVAGRSHIAAQRSGGGRQTGPVLLSVGPEPEAGDRTVTNPWADFQVHPTYLDAEIFEARYGDSEVAQMLYGLRNMWADHAWNTQQQILPHLAPYREKVEANERRAARIRADAARNAADLGFPPGW